MWLRNYGDAPEIHNITNFNRAAPAGTQPAPSASNSHLATTAQLQELRRRVDGNLVQTHN
jgi:hypothetical protein